MPLLPRLMKSTALALTLTMGAGGNPFGPQAPGRSSQAAIPAWVPVYPGAKTEVLRSQPDSTESYLWFKIISRDPCGRVWRFYDEKLKLAGFSVVNGGSHGAEDCVGVMRSHTAGGTREVNLTGGVSARGTEYEVEVVERGGAQGGADQRSRPASGTRRESGAANGGIPAWLPVYPRWAPQNVSAQQSGSESFISFNFTSRDDARTILSWYQDRLRQAGFNVSMDVAGTNGALRSNTRDNSRAVKIEVSAAGGQNVVLMEIRDQR
jgi:hypothetical protein